MKLCDQMAIYLWLCLVTCLQCAVREEQSKREVDRLINERKNIALQRKDELEGALEHGRKAMVEQQASFEKEMDEISIKNAKLICKFIDVS